MIGLPDRLAAISHRHPFWAGFPFHHLVAYCMATTKTPICSHALRMGAHRKEISVDKKLHQIREQTEWKITLDLLYIFCKPTQPRTDASSTKWDITLRVTGLPCPAQKLFSHFIPCYFSPCSLKKSCSNMPILEMGLSVRKVKVPADCWLGAS